MGVKGLTTYINQNAHRYLSPHELHDCNLVIDGNNLCCQLYKWCGPFNSAFGGDYDRYYQTVSNFFEMLRACHVTPYVIMDGGYETRKLRTVHFRLRQKIAATSRCTPSSQNVIQVFPLLLKHAFKDVLRKFSVAFAQCDFEADDEIAAVARKLHCPVLSYDSDFYIYNVPYIPFSTLELGVSQKKIEGGKSLSYMKCKIYHVEGLIKHFGGLDEKLLPLMAVLLGNDFVNARIFKNFFLNVKLPSSKKMSNQQKKIATVIEWLKQETVESALTKILSRFKKEKRAYLSSLFERSIRIYTEDFSNTLKYLGLSSNPGSMKTTVSLPAIEINDEATASWEEEKVAASDCDNDNETDCENESECDDFEIEVETAVGDTQRSFPDWLLDQFRAGYIDASMANIFYLSRFYLEPQVEDYTLAPAYEVGLPILRVVFGFLVKSDQVLKDDEEYGLICFGRNNRGKPQKFVLTPVFSTVSVKDFCNLSSLNTWPMSTKLSVLYDTLTICDKKEVKLLDSFPEEWKLYAMAIVYWGRKNKEWPHVTNCHIHALVLAIVALGVIDSKVGYFRSNSIFLKKNGTRIRKAQSALDEKSEKKSKSSNKNAKNLECNSEVKKDSVEFHIRTVLENVSEDECLFLVGNMIDYHQGKSTSYSLTAVHSFAQFQSCLSQALCLNSLLGFPVPHCNIASMYSGKFVTSAYADFSKRSNLEAYLDLLMRSSPSIRALHSALVRVFFHFLPSLLQLVRKGKNKRKKKASKRANVELTEDQNDEGTDDNDGGDIISDVENRFSVLSMQ